jgi:2,5-diketo-D-gluconate reductase A
MDLQYMIRMIATTLLAASSFGCHSQCHVVDALSASSSQQEISRRSAIQQAATVTLGGTMGLYLPPQSTFAAETSAAINPVATLSDGSKFPLTSFGLQIYNDETAYKLTMTALEAGYRNFFASVLAGNQKGFAKAVKASGIPREELYICGSVVSNRVSGFEEAKKLTTKGWKKNMECFSVGDIGYLDQILLDYPGPDCSSIQGQWASFEEMHAQKLTKSLSVSNFSPAQLDCVLSKAKVKPVVNQLPYSVAYHPGNSVAENAKRGILVQAWAPLGGSLGGRFSSSMKGTCGTIGKKYGKSWAQVALRWIVQTGASFTTQSKNGRHFKEDLDIFDFELTEEEMSSLSRLA